MRDSFLDPRLVALCAALLCLSPDGTIVGVARAQQAGQATRPDSIRVDPRARIVEHDSSAFGRDPSYADGPYDHQAQLAIYGDKHMNPTQRPLLELGRALYDNGPFAPARSLLGKHNVLIPQLLVYGDFRTAAGLNGGVNAAGTTVSDGTWGNRLNVDVDFKITATERFHALFRPLEKKGQFTRFDFGGDSTGFRSTFDAAPVAAFFEGDLGAMVGGLIRRDTPFDLPVAAGLIPLLFHNGTWLEDAFTGAAATIPARNSRRLGWSNFDLTFFYGANRVSNPTVGDGRDHGQILGGNTFIEAYHGYIEAGYAHIAGANDGGRDFHSVAFSFTRRYGGRVSNSVRYIGALGKGADSIAGSANGHLLLVENSLITSRPTTVVPYLNLFYGVGSPVSAARDAGAGGILKNTGLSFEADALTRFSALDASARDALGGALGLEILGSRLNRQLVVEFAAATPHITSATLPGAQYGVGLRIQQPLTNAIILRVDGMYGQRQKLTAIHGMRLELRHKF
jgi:hypothetical protein